MGRTRPLLQQIIMGVKINLAKWSDALLETSNCFSLIFLPPPHSLRAANDAVVGADVSLEEEGFWGVAPKGIQPVYCPGLSHSPTPSPPIPPGCLTPGPGFPLSTAPHPTPQQHPGTSLLSPHRSEEVKEERGGALLLAPGHLLPSLPPGTSHNHPHQLTQWGSVPQAEPQCFIHILTSRPSPQPPVLK